MQLIAIIADKVIYTICHPLLENSPTAEIIMRNQNVVCRFEIGNQFLPIPETCRPLESTWWIWEKRENIHLGSLSCSYTNNDKILKLSPPWNIHLYIQFFFFCRHRTDCLLVSCLVRWFLTLLNCVCFFDSTVPAQPSKTVVTRIWPCCCLVWCKCVKSPLHFFFFGGFQPFLVGKKA